MVLLVGNLLICLVVMLGFERQLRHIQGREDMAGASNALFEVYV